MLKFSKRWCTKLQVNGQLGDSSIMLSLCNCRMLEKRSLSYVDGPIEVPIDNPFLVDNVQRISICDTGMLSREKLKFPAIFTVSHVNGKSSGSNSNVQ